MISRVSVGVSLGIPSSGTSEPRWRIIGGTPAVRCRSDALRLTTWMRMSEKSNSISDPSSASAAESYRGQDPRFRLPGERAPPSPLAFGDGTRPARRARSSVAARLRRRYSARAGDASDLGDGGQAAADLLQAVLAEAHHAL